MGDFSMLITLEQPLDTSSKLILPVPPNKSKADRPSQSIQLLSILNRFSFAKSVVGLALKLDGTSILRPLYLPLIILILLIRLIDLRVFYAHLPLRIRLRWVIPMIQSDLYSREEEGVFAAIPETRIL